MPPAGTGGPSAGSQEMTPSALTTATAAVDEDHLNLYRVLNSQITPLRSILAKDTPESFRYDLQEGQLLTYRVEDERQGCGFCTLLPWGYIFTCDHQPAEHVYKVYQASAGVSFTSALTFLHRSCVCFYPANAQYVIHDIPLHLLSPWAHDQSARSLVPPLHAIEDEMDDFDLDGQ